METVCTKVGMVIVFFCEDGVWVDWFGVGGMSKIDSSTLLRIEMVGLVEEWCLLSLF